MNFLKIKTFRFLCAVLLLRFTECQPKPRPPHIVFIMVDDLGWNDVSFHGSKQIPTPNIDALAKDGIILQNYYVSPMCTPSRGSLMTGKHPIRLGLQHLVIVADAPWALSSKEKIFPQYLKELGYVNHGVGKWHLGFYKDRYLPHKRGFDSFYGYWTGVKDYYTHFSDMQNKTGLDLHKDLASDWHQNGTYGTDLFTVKAKNVILSHDQSKPLFLFLAQQAVHGGNMDDPLQAPPKYVKRFPHILDDKRKTYAGMVSALDDCIGQIFSALRKAKMLDNTIIVFTTDNGGAVQGTDGIAGSNFPLRGSKYNMWEGGVRGVSFLWSSHLRPVSRVSKHLMHVSDWLPTLYSAAGGDASKLESIDGYNLWPSLVYDFPSPRQEVLHNIDPIWNVEGVRKRNFKLIKGSAFEGALDGWYDQNGRELGGGIIPIEPLPLRKRYRRAYRRLLKKSKVAKILQRKYGKLPIAPGRCIGECKKQLIVKCGPKSEESAFSCKPNGSPCLFDIDTDPCEYHNIAEQLPEVVEELENLLAEYKKLAIPPRNKDSDPNVNPMNSGNAWVPWK